MNQKTLRLVEKKITRVLANLPDERLSTLVQTQDQVKFWLAIRHNQKFVSQCWEARYNGKDDPLKPLLDLGRVNQDIYDRVWLVVDFYEQLWGLVQLVTPYVKLELEGTGLEFLAESAFKLFTRLVYKKVNSTFAVCLKPYYESSSRKYEQACRLGSKAIEEGLNPIQQTKLRGLLNQEEPDLLLQFVIAIADQKATRRRVALKSKLGMFYLSLNKLYEKEATISRKVDSFAWKNGREIKASKHGGTYSGA